MSMHAHERVAELELQVKALESRGADKLSEAAVEYCRAFAEFRELMRLVNRIDPGEVGRPEDWSRRARSMQARMDAAWTKFEREAAKRPATPPPQQHRPRTLFETQTE